MKQFNLPLVSLLLLCCFSGCKKEEIDTTDYYQEASVHCDDHARFSSEMDAVANDVNFALEMTPGFTGKPATVLNSVCDASIVADTLSNPRTITITYNGTNCLLNRKRSGKIILSMDVSTRWKNAGAKINLNFVNFKITRLKDNKDMIFNGKVLLTNVSGALVSDLASVSNVTHTIFSDGIDILFDNGKEWSWKTARKRVYRQNNGLVITTTGTHAGGVITGIADWGNNRFGHPFLTPILIPLESRQDCNFRTVQGKIQLILTDHLYATCKLGLNESGSPISCPGTSSYWLELIWRDPKGTRCLLRLPYE